METDAISTLQQKKNQFYLRGSNCKTDLIEEDCFKQLKNEELSQAHLGLILVRVKGMHSETLGAKVLVCLYDNRFNSLEQSILGNIEIDMCNKRAIMAFSPDYIGNTSTLYKDIQIGTKSQGYEMKQGDIYSISWKI